MSTTTSDDNGDDETRLDSSKHTKHANSISQEESVRALWITYLNIALYALSYNLQRPVEPFLVQSLSKNADNHDEIARTYGQLQAFFSTIQTIGSPLVGILLDRIGVRRASAVVFAASALSYAILASAHSMPLLFLSKLPTALQHAFLVAQAIAATSTAGNDVSRSAALARMTTAYTIGASVGPALGGFLAGHGDMYLSARLAVVGSLVSVVLSLVFLPDVNTTKTTTSETTAQQSEVTTTNPHKVLKSARSFWQDLQHQANIAMQASLLPLLTVKVLGGVSASIHSTALPLVLTQDLRFEPALLGLAMSCSMFAVAAFGAVAMAPLTNWMGPDGLAQVGLMARVLWGSLLAVLVTTSVVASDGVMIEQQHQIIAVSVLRELSSHVLATGLTTQTTGAVTPEEQGALLGLEHGLFSLARIGGPPLATALLTRVGTFWAVAAACGGLDVCLVAVLVMARNLINSGQKSKLK